MYLHSFAVLLSGLMAISFVIPWLEIPGQGSLSPLILAQDLNWSNFDLSEFQERIEWLSSRIPELQGLTWAALALVISFPLAALFMLIGLMGYYGKFMGVLLGGIPVVIFAYAAYGFYRVSEFVDSPFELEDTLGRLVESFQQSPAYGLPIYAGAGILLFLVSLIDPGRRPSKI